MNALVPTVYRLGQSGSPEGMWPWAVQGERPMVLAEMGRRDSQERQE